MWSYALQNSQIQVRKQNNQKIWSLLRCVSSKTENSERNTKNIMNGSITVWNFNFTFA